MINEKLELIGKQACSMQQVALYDIIMKPAKKGKVITFFITKIGGVTIEDCQSVSRIISDELENADFIKGSYYIEVSSPGLDRPLKLKKHYISAIDELIDITFINEEKSVETVTAKLLEVNPDSIRFEIKDKEMIREVSYSDIKKAKVHFEF
ncbi:MAG: ribosome maturation factor RimP [Candidatus Cloacimonetes bacterium]|nr:ribosome maturation factor RimP [Candidatus Cloacimonadota bacterium]